MAVSRASLKKSVIDYAINTLQPTVDYDLHAILIPAGTSFTSTTFTFEVSAGDDTELGTLQTLANDGDYTVTIPSAGEALVMDQTLFAPWTSVKIVPNNAADNNTVIYLALRYKV